MVLPIISNDGAPSKPHIELLNLSSLFKRALLSALPPRVVGWLRTWRVRATIMGFRPRVVEHCYGELPLRVYLADPLAERWYDHDWADLPEMAMLRSGSLRAGARVFDAGAHQGIVAMMLGRVVGEHGLVIAIEACRHNVEVMIKNLELNYFPQIHVMSAAISDRMGTVPFNQGLNGQLDDGTGASGRVNVESVTIDSLADKFGMPDLVYIDIEGAECLALSGASNVLRARTDFFVEVHVGVGLEKLGGTAEQVLSYFPPQHYELLGCGVNSKKFHPIALRDTITLSHFFLFAFGRRPCRGFITFDRDGHTR